MGSAHPTLPTLDARVRAPGVRGAKFPVRGVFRRVDAPALPRDVHDRRSVPDLLPDASGVDRLLLRSDSGARVAEIGERNESHARHQSHSPE